ncbi:hypothetical protein NIES4071_09710 [Calothrix sp. NIES-4071]|nr:hypothetical protein NIES4071_09710 [Calothrix sp. NIES-4071]BAZ55313.1 hypothetical protein NIES4105_09670 [Calothrix sp. NIES-4105]
MKSVFVLGLLAVAGCEAQNLSKTPKSAETTVTTTTSQVVQTTAPTPQIPQITTLPTPSALQTILPTAPAQTLPPLPPLTQQTSKPVVTNIDKPITSSSKLAANIRSSIGCGVVNEEYRTKVVAMAIAQTNPKATEKLTEPQFYQAVKQSISSNQAKANNLVAQFRAQNCSQSTKKTTTDKTQAKAPSAAATPDGKVILEQSGNCGDLRARGISNIDVKINPWASALDTDKDGIACEAS